MSQSEKAVYYKALKQAGVTFPKHYREYSTEELKTAWGSLAAEQGLEVELEVPVPKDAPPPREDEVAQLRQQMASVVDVVESLAKMVSGQQRREEQHPPQMSTKPEPKEGPQQGVKEFRHDIDPKMNAGVTQNTHQGLEILRVDEHGNKWFQEEVKKPDYPRRRARRVLRYMDPGVKKESIKVGDYFEEFEVAGDPSSAVPKEIRVTLPAYQVGIYQPPNMPFKVHTYQGMRGFDLFDVQKYYGGSDLVPSSIKRCYVSSDLCYDITTTIRAIEDEYRERVLKSGKGLR